MSLTSTFCSDSAPALVTVIVKVTVAPGMTGVLLVRCFTIEMSQMSLAMSLKMDVMSLGLPGKYPPGEAMFDSSVASFASIRSYPMTYSVVPVFLACVAQ